MSSSFGCLWSPVHWWTGPCGTCSSAQRCPASVPAGRRHGTVRLPHEQLRLPCSRNHLIHIIIILFVLNNLILRTHDYVIIGWLFWNLPCMVFISQFSSWLRVWSLENNNLCAYGPVPPTPPPTTGPNMSDISSSPFLYSCFASPPSPLSSAVVCPQLGAVCPSAVARIQMPEGSADHGRCHFSRRAGCHRRCLPWMCLPVPGRLPSRGHQQWIASGTKN